MGWKFSLVGENRRCIQVLEEACLGKQLLGRLGSK